MAGRGWIVERFFRAASLELTANAEAANAIAVDVQLSDQEGNALDGAVQYLVEVVDEDMLLGLVAAWTMAETGNGTEDSTTAMPRLLVTLGENGDAQVTLTDVSGASTDTMGLMFIPVGHHGPAAYTTVTFA